MTPPPINIDGTNENYSNVTIDGQDVTQITIDGQDVLSTIPDSTVSRTGDTDSFSKSTKRGIKFKSTVDWPKIGAILSDNTGSPTRAYIHRSTDGVLIGDTDITGLSAGDSFTVKADISAGVEYNFVVDSEGSNYTYGYDGNGSLPKTSADGKLTMTSGAKGSTGTPADPSSIVTIGNVGF